MNRESCINCIWCSCKNYGYDKTTCDKYIPETFTKKEGK